MSDSELSVSPASCPSSPMSVSSSDIPKPRKQFQLLREETEAALAPRPQRDPTLPPPIVVALDADIATGKSSVLAWAAAHLRTKGFTVAEGPEPVSVWQESGILPLYYGDRERHGMEFQNFVATTRIDEMTAIYEADPNVDIILLERTLFTDRFVFVRDLSEAGLVTDMQLAMYNRSWTAQLRMMPFQISGFIWLEADMPLLMKRLRGRGREGEEALTEEIQYGLREKHRQFFELLREPAQIGLPANVRSTKVCVNEDYRTHVAEPGSADHKERVEKQTEFCERLAAWITSI